MSADTKKEYLAMFRKFKAGEITEVEWKVYCIAILEELIKENRDILLRLKNS